MANVYDPTWNQKAMSGGEKAESFLLGNGAPDRNPITAFNFVLQVEGVYFLPLRSVHAFTKENEYEYIREGGLNDYVHLKRKQISKPFTFQVERYIGTDRFMDPLALGTELVLPLILHVYRHKAMQGFGSGPDAWPARLFVFTGCSVMSKEYSELNAEKSGLLTETVTIAYRELMVIANALDDMVKMFSDGKSSALSPERDAKPFAKYKDEKSGRMLPKYAMTSPNDGDWDKTNKNYKASVNIQRYDKDGKATEDSHGGDKYEFTKDGKTANTENVRANRPDNDKARAKVEKYEFTKDGKKANLVNKRAIRPEADDSRAVIEKYEFTTDGKTPILENKRANRPDKDKARAKVEKYEFTEDGKKANRKNKRANRPKEDDSRAVIEKYEFTKDGKKANLVNKRAIRPEADDSRAVIEKYEFTTDGKTPILENKRANRPDKDKARAKVEKYEFTEDGKKANRKNKRANRPKEDAARAVVEKYEFRTDLVKNKRANRPKEDAARAVVEKYEFKTDLVKNKRAISPKNDKARAKVEKYEFKTDKERNVRALVPEKDKERAPVVKWPPTRRAMMADVLSGKK